MRNLLKCIGLSLLVVSLVACDGKSESEKSDAHTQSGLSLLAGKVTFAIPPEMHDITETQGALFKNLLGTSAKNVAVIHVYSDSTGQRVIALTQMTKNSVSMSESARQFISTMSINIPKLQVLTDKSFTINNHQMRRIDMRYRLYNQPLFQSSLITQVNGSLITLQITLAGDNLRNMQSEVDDLFTGLQIK